MSAMNAMNLLGNEKLCAWCLRPGRRVTSGGKRYEENVKSSKRRQQAGNPWLRGPCL